MLYQMLGPPRKVMGIEQNQEANKSSSRLETHEEVNQAMYKEATGDFTRHRDGSKPPGLPRAQGP